jgi:hypothetical protein
MSSADPSSNSGQRGVVLRRVLYFILLIGLSLLYLLVFFRGLSHEKGMDQAQIAREIARGEGPRTKVLRPVAIWQSQQASGGEATLAEASYDTYHAPLHPMLLAVVFKLVGADEHWKMAEDEMVYKADRIVALTSVLCFLVAIGVNYLLICRLFDARIAGVTAVLLLLCELNWRFSQSGLPQMLMLLLFSCAMFFVFRAIECTQEGRMTIVPVFMAGLFFGLLALTHWLAIWIVIGYIVYASIFIRPRALAGIIAVVFLAVFSAFSLYKNVEYTGSLGGTALLALYNGLGGSEDLVMRTYNLQEASLPLRNLPQKILRTLLTQSASLYVYLGSIIVAPIFFLSLMHAFKRPTIAAFRWCVLIMWLMAAVGMAIYGLSDKGIDSNQLHLLFAPIMSAYGLAFVAILWNRLQISADMSQLRNGHFFLVVFLSAGPMLLSLPRDIRDGFYSEVKMPYWPPYFPSVLNSRLSEITLENEIIVSDQPWAVAWYADRRSLWLPRRPEVLEKIEGMAEDQNTPITGILITPYSHGMKPMPVVYNEYNEFSALIFDGWANLALRGRRAGILAEEDPRIKTIVARYPHRAYLNSSLMMYWSAQPLY